MSAPAGVDSICSCCPAGAAVPVPGVDGVEDDADVGFAGEEDGAGGGQDAAGGGAELEVGDAVGCEVGEDGAGCEG